MFDIGEVAIETRRGPRHAMVVTPRTHVRVGRERLENPRGREMSEVDRLLLEQMHAREGRICVVIFRGRNDEGSASWGFEEDLDSHQANDLALDLLRGMVLVYRSFFEAGVCVHAHADWGPVEARAFRDANGVLIGELGEKLQMETLTPVVRRQAELELWTLRNLTFFFTLGFSTLVGSVLPEKLPLLEMRTERLRERANASMSMSLLAH